VGEIRCRSSTASPNARWSGLAWLTGFIVIFLGIGFAGFRRRDIN